MGDRARARAPRQEGGRRERERVRERREETSNREVPFLSSSDNFTEKISANSLEPFDYFFGSFLQSFKDLKKAPRS